VILVLVALFPALSRAVATITCVAFVSVVVSRDFESGLAVEVAIMFPSTNAEIWKSPDMTWPAMVGSEAVAERVIMPDTVAPFVGLVRETVGAVVSGFRFTVTVAWLEAVPEAFVAVSV